MFVFDIIAVAFGIALVLYEYYQYLAAHGAVATMDPMICWDPVKQRVYANGDLRRPVQTARIAAHRINIRYMNRSVLFHQINASRHREEPDFKSLPYFGIAAMVAVMFLAVGLPPLTAVGVGIGAGLVTFASKQGQDLLLFSDKTNALDDDIKSLNLRIANARREAHSQGRVWPQI